MKKLFVLLALFSLCFSFNVPPVSADDVDQYQEFQFTWDHNQEADLAGYRIYMSPVPGGYNFGSGNEFEQIPAGVAVSEKHTMPVGVYYFVITAIDTGGFESDPSNELTVSVIDTPPSAPTGCAIIKF